MKTLQEVRNYLSNVNGINFGGCAIAAIAMKRWLNENTDKEVKIIYAFESGDDDTYIENSLALRDIDEYNFTSCTHAGIKLQNQSDVIDCYNSWSRSKYKYTLTMPEDAVINSLNEGIEDWNPEFDRNNIKKISKELKVDLSDIYII